MASKKLKTGKKNHQGEGGGRPATYTREYLDLLASEMLDWFKDKRRYWLKDFAINKGIPSTRFVEFSEKSEKFLEAYLLCKDIQESRLVKKGFTPYKDRFASFALKNVAGWRERTDITTGDAPITGIDVMVHRVK
jgi:hypothetical protein